MGLQFINTIYCLLGLWWPWRITIHLIENYKCCPKNCDTSIPSMDALLLVATWAAYLDGLVQWTDHTTCIPNRWLSWKGRSGLKAVLHIFRIAFKFQGVKRQQTDLPLICRNCETAVTQSRPCRSGAATSRQHVDSVGESDWKIIQRMHRNGAMDWEKRTRDILRKRRWNLYIPKYNMTL